MKIALASNTYDFAAALETLLQMPAVVEQMMKQFRNREREKLSKDVFSILEHACHLRDLEKEGYLTRIEKILAETNPSLPDFEGDKIALERDYNNQNPLTAFNDFKAARQKSVEKLKSLAPDKLMRKGELEGVGTINLENLTCLMLEHDKSHLKELKELAAQLLQKI